MIIIVQQKTLPDGVLLPLDAQTLLYIEIRQVEGFVRQILGWCEYMRGIYWALMPDLAAMNYFDHQGALHDFCWTGDTRMNCLRAAAYLKDLNRL